MRPTLHPELEPLDPREDLAVGLPLLDYREFDGIRLRPANDAMDPLVFEEGEVEILGVVSGVGGG